MVFPSLQSSFPCASFISSTKNVLFQSRFVPSQVVFGGQLDFSCSLSPDEPQWPVELGSADLPVCLTCNCLCPCDLQVGHSPRMMKCPLTFPALPWQFLRSNKNGNKKRQQSAGFSIVIIWFNTIISGVDLCYLQSLAVINYHYSNFTQCCHGLKSLIQKKMCFTEEAPAYFLNHNGHLN